MSKNVKPTSLSLRLEPLNGADPLDVFHEMVRVAAKLGILVDADLNGIFVSVAPESDPLDLHTEWMRKMSKASRFRKGTET